MQSNQHQSLKAFWAQELYETGNNCLKRSCLSLKGQHDAHTTITANIGRTVCGGPSHELYILDLLFLRGHPAPAKLNTAQGEGRKLKANAFVTRKAEV